MKFVKLGDICKVRNGYAFKSEKFTESGVPIVRISDINGNFVNPIKSVRTTYENLFDNFKITKGDILIAMSGATTGKFGIYNADEDAYQNQRVGCFKILDKQIVDQTYLLQTLKVVKPIIEKKANGGAQPNISASGIEEITIPLPPLSDQIRIAQILSQAESLIAQRKQSISLLDELLKSTFLEMFGDPVRNEKEWEISNIGKQCDVKGGKRIPKESKLVEENTGYPYIKAGNIKKGKITTTDLEYLTPEIREQLKRYIVEKGDVCITVVGANIGDIGIVPEELHLANLTENANKLLIKDKGKINNNYLGYYLMMDFVQNNFNSNIRAAGVPKLAIFRIEQVELLMPPIELQTKFANIVEKVDALKSQYQQSLTELQNMYGVLSQKAFKGELSLDKVNQSI